MNLLLLLSFRHIWAATAPDSGGVSDEPLRVFVPTYVAAKKWFGSSAAFREAVKKRNIDERG